MAAAPTPTGVGYVPTLRLASSYKPVERRPLSEGSYPSGLCSLIPSIHDSQYYQGILNNSNNFSQVTKCDIYEMRGNFAAWHHDLDEVVFTKYLQNCNHDGPKTSFRAIFCSLDNVRETTFGLRLSLTQTNTKDMLKKFKISPQFVPLLFAEPDYWSPGDFSSHDLEGSLQQLEFFCQQPRWNILSRQTPWSVYMSYDVHLACTTYVIACGSENPLNSLVKARLEVHLGGPSETVTAKSHTKDPFLLHCMIFHESFTEAKAIITKLRHRLYDQLDMVDAYAKNPSDRKNLENLTIELHGVSQDTDSLLASADMADMIATKMAKAHRRFEAILTDANLKDKTTKLEDALGYLQSSVQSQRRWLLSYKSRKDIAMNLVFNLVTQQDSATTTLIARETKADSSSMKTIAALTMVFLPGTFMSSVFGLKFVGDAQWWLYVAITLPLTVVVVIIWWFWTTYPVSRWVKTALANGWFPKRIIEKTTHVGVGSKV